MSVDFSNNYNNWTAVDPVDLFSVPVVRKETDPKAHMVSFLHREAKDSEYLVLWLDCDKEGENICFEVIDAVKTALCSRPVEQPRILRAKFSAVTARDIKQAMSNLILPDRNQALSVDARQELDLRVGCAFTRFQTMYLQGQFSGTETTLISYGPCQTPSLAFCVARADEIKNFVPRPYWVIEVQVMPSQGHRVHLTWNKERVFVQAEAAATYTRLKGTKHARVTNVASVQKTKAKPEGLNTVELLRIASSAFGLSPQHTMHIAERLYTQGYISYPRTESTSYSENYDLRAKLDMLAGTQWSKYASQLKQGGLERPRQGVDVGDHPPITPEAVASPDAVGNDGWRIYQYIVAHFLASISPDCVYSSCTVQFDVHGEQFSCNGTTMVKPGFTEVMPSHSPVTGSPLPTFRKDQQIEICSMDLVQKMTTPPDFLSESELITLMEKNGIGTDASIPVHINNICERNYVTVIAGRRLEPTILGLSLIHGYEKIDKELCAPFMRSEMEKQLDMIAKGKAKFEVVLQTMIKVYLDKFLHFQKNIQAMVSLFEKSFPKVTETARMLTRCGQCKRFMRLVEGPRPWLQCTQCDRTYTLPLHSRVKQFKDERCPFDDFGLILLTNPALSNSGREAIDDLVVCPRCYNEPPFEDMAQFSVCLRCSHESCPQSLASNTIGDCDACTDGAVVLDLSHGKKPRIFCISCNLTYCIGKSVLDLVLVKDTTCPSCESNEVIAKFAQGAGLLGGVETYRGCIFCDQLLSSVVKPHRPVVGEAAAGRGPSRARGRSRGRGRGRGRGGRGRGQGQGQDHDGPSFSGNRARPGNGRGGGRGGGRGRR